MRLLISITLMVFTLTGCAASSKKMAVMIPPVNTSSTTASITALPNTVAVLPLANRTHSTKAFEVVRRTLFNHFSSKNYHTLYLKDVDRKLKAGNLNQAEKIDGMTPSELASTLNVDALLYSENTHYEKIFAGIYAQIAVGLHLHLVNHQGQEIWYGEDVARSHAGGISTTPVGLVLDALAAINQVRGDVNLYRAADELGRNFITEIPESKALASQQFPRIVQVIHDGAAVIVVMD